MQKSKAHTSSNPRKHILKISLQKSVLAESNIVNKVTPSGENGTWENLNYRNFYIMEYKTTKNIFGNHEKASHGFM